MKRLRRLEVDSMILIYLIERKGEWIEAIKKHFQEADEVILSSLSFGEILTGFEKNKDLKGKLEFLSFIESFKKIHIANFCKQEALYFAQIRAKYPQIKAPDAIHLATALSARADAFLTNDKYLKVFEELPVLLLTD
jgi:predicted nucleic acid-binding protein